MTKYVVLWPDMPVLLFILQTDVTEVAGYTEFMGWTIINGTDEATPLIGLQKASTMPALQTISGTNSSDTFTFTWRFVGVQANQVCCCTRSMLPVSVLGVPRRHTTAYCWMVHLGPVVSMSSKSTTQAQYR